MQITDSARAILERRYLSRDEHGKVTETVEGMFKRVADAIAEADLIYDKNADILKTSERFYNMMTSLIFCRIHRR
jgi:ribonucleoside-diphosphate reductase alpha chain